MRPAKWFFNDHIKTVATPSIWGSGLAQWVGYFMEPKARVVNATPLADGSLAIAPMAADLVAGQRVLLIDNLIISGATIERFVHLTEQLGGEVVGIATLWRSGPPTIAGHRVYSVLNDVYEAFPADACPFCQAGNPAEVVGY